MSRAPKVCTAPGCPETAEPGNSRCPQHKRPAWQGGQQGKHSTTWAWQKLRRAILDRDRWTCTTCGAPATDVDHIVPRSKGGTDAPANLAATCSRCHKAKTAADRKERPSP